MASRQGRGAERAVVGAVSKKPIPRRVNHVAMAIRRDFTDVLSMEDFVKRSPAERESAFLSRGLAALFARSLTGVDSKTAAEFVVDGRNDYGIDAVAIADGSPQIWLIQAKWSNSGSAGFGVADALKLVNGLTIIDQRDYDRFNTRFSALADRVNAVLDNPAARITLLVAVMGSEPPSKEVVECFEDAKQRFGPMLDYRFCGIDDAWEIVHRESLQTLTLEANMEKWLQMQFPYEAYQGSVSAADVAEWFEEHRDRLFEQNIRKSLGLTRVNSEIVQTLLESPEIFWYFNNGITILCEGIDAVPFSRGNPAGPVRLCLKNASVVNGAQTVTSIHEAFKKDPEAVTKAHVSIRVISTRNCPDGFGNAVTMATNTQNRVEPRDFIALDPVQGEIRDDFRLGLERPKTYVFRRGELEPPPDAGCSIDEAALALACAHTDARIVARVKTDKEVLWQKGSQGVYTKIFSERPSAHQIWRSVLLHRAIREALHKEVRKHRGRAQSIAEHGDMMLAHLIFQHAGLDYLDVEEEEWRKFLKEVPALVKDILARMIHFVDVEFAATSFVRSAFTNEDRCRILARGILAAMGSGDPAPTIPDEYLRTARKSRKPNAVHVIVDSGRIPDGTRLIFRTGGAAEEEALAAWLAEDPRRGEARWVNERGRPLLWSGDGKQYSPTGLVSHMWRLAEWDSAPVAVQGTRRWVLADGASLVDVADAVLREREGE